MTATPASHPFEIHEHDADGVRVMALRGCRRETEVDGGRLAVAAQAAGAIGRMFSLAGAHEMLPVYADTESALAALAPRPS